MSDGRLRNVSGVYARPSKGESATSSVNASADWLSGSAVIKLPHLINRHVARSSHHSARGHAAGLIQKISAIGLVATIRFDHLAVEQPGTATTNVDGRLSAYVIVVASTLCDNSLSKISAVSPSVIHPNTASAIARLILRWMKP